MKHKTKRRTKKRHGRGKPKIARRRRVSAKRRRAALKGWQTRRKRERAKRRKRRKLPKPVEYVLRAAYDSPRGKSWDAAIEIHIFAPHGATENQLISQLIEWSAGERLRKGWRIRSIDWGKGELDSASDIDIAREALGAMDVTLEQTK